MTTFASIALVVVAFVSAAISLYGAAQYLYTSEQHRQRVRDLDERQDQLTGRVMRMQRDIKEEVQKYLAEIDPESLSSGQAAGMDLQQLLPLLMMQGGGGPFPMPGVNNENANGGERKSARQQMKERQQRRGE